MADRAERAFHSTESLHDWMKERKEKLSVSLQKISLRECSPWYYDEAEGCIRNAGGSFFRIYGVQQYRHGVKVLEQPII